MDLIKLGFRILVLTGAFHLYFTFPDLKPLLIFFGYVVGFLILRKGFFKNGGSFLKQKE